MVCAATTHEEFVRKNPTWGKAKTGPDKKQWLEADDAEKKQLLTVQKGRDSCSFRKARQVFLKGYPYFRLNDTAASRPVECTKFVGAC